jgi:plastocyanin
MKTLTLLVLTFAAVALAACGGDGGSSTATSDKGERPDGPVAESPTYEFDLKEKHPGTAMYGSPPLEFEADPGGDLAYTTDEVTAKEGNVTIEFTNPQPVPHNVAIEGSGGGRVETHTIAEDFDAVTITLNTKEKFIFYCTVPGHRKAGMEGIVKVEARN